jgi:hypothetical protein
MPFFGVPIRNGLPIGLGSSAGFGVQPFDPSYLFAAGEQGAWYDPSDYSTLFDDSAGITPVTGVEQFVGLMLDKSKGLVLGSELAAGILGSTSGWTFVGAANVTGGAIVFNTPPSTNASAQYNPIVASGKWYQSTITITGTGQVNVQFGSAGSTVTLVAPGTYTFRGSASGGTPTVLTFSSVLSGVNNFVGSVTAISVRELPGNHAFQTNSLKRPKLAARYNLLTYSEEFDNAAWSVFAASVSVNSVQAPDSTLTADTLTALAGSGFHLLQQTSSITVAANISHTHSISVKKNNYDFVTVSVNSGSTTNWFAVTVDLSTTTISQTGAGSGGTYTSSSVIDSGNGWYRIIVTGSLGAQTVARTNVSISPSATPTYSSNSYVTWTAAGTEAVYIWGADLRPASQATGLIGPTYQRVAAATVYDTAGFLPYLAFDGLSWSMGTNSIDFSAGDKVTAWAGVRKLSDAAAGIFAELSASSGANTGAFYLALPESNLVRYSFFGRGSATVNANQLASTNSSTYLAPVTNVLTATGNISGDSNILRIDATQVAAATGDQGSGNYGNYPLYIGARNNANFFFSGWLTSLIVRGAESTQSQIEATEAWVNSRTGAY